MTNAILYQNVYYMYYVLSILIQTNLEHKLISFHQHNFITPSVSAQNDNPTSNNSEKFGKKNKQIDHGQTIVQVEKKNEFFEDHCRRLPSPQRFRLDLLSVSH